MRLVVNPCKRYSQRHKITVQKQGATAWHTEEKNIPTLCFRWQSLESVLLSLSAAVPPCKVYSYRSSKTHHRNSTRFIFQKVSFHEKARSTSLQNQLLITITQKHFQTWSRPKYSPTNIYDLILGSESQSRSTLWRGNATQLATKLLHNMSCWLRNQLSQLN